jgi:hypothetical protein
MYKRICARTSETEDDFVAWLGGEKKLVEDIPRVLPYLNVTAESLETRGALYEPVVKLVKCFQAYRPDTPYAQALL